MGGWAIAPFTSSSSLLQRTHFSLHSLDPVPGERRHSRGRCKPFVRASSEADPEGSSPSSSSSSSSITIISELSATEKAKIADNDSRNKAPSPALSKEISQVVKKTAATFAPRSSTKSRNPAVPGSTLYTVFEVQGYASMALGGLLSFNLLFPSSEPDLWRLMGMWSVWMFTIPSLRARDCSNKEKDALNYLFLGIPLINVVLPLFWKSFAAVWTADVLVFLVIYAWKLDWLSVDPTKEK